MMRPHKRKVRALIRRIQNALEHQGGSRTYRNEFLEGVFYVLCMSQGYTYENHIENVLKEVEESHENKSQC